MSKVSNILVVDDNLKNIQVGINFLKQNKDYHLIFATSGEQALERVKENSFDLILLDIIMPGLDGYEVCSRLKADDATRNIPILFLTAKQESENIVRGFETGGADYITKPFNSEELKARVKTHLELKQAKDDLENQNMILESKVTERTEQLQALRDATVISLSALVETRDNETGNHIIRTQKYVELIATELKKNEKYSSVISDEIIEYLKKTAPLHDIGKVGIRDSILHKPEKLNSEEFEIMKLHTTYGYEALKKAEELTGKNTFLYHAKNLAYSHHEKWDGTGYPRGLAGDEIPFEGRIMAIADVYDALISRRVYKAPLSHSESVEIIREGRSFHFDPDIVDAFLAVSDDIACIAQSHNDSDG